ncbi:DUF4237 domain-containing protein [Solihabitans fulvus]|uniref:DUF4237 domain-containing protein n=1 Tax=Solihabitans fulvus TaxID=1892852 RepID=A0A5B2XP31_9PSEU|nr:TNT domain-containing protein [Solihabitans fulvus]KAA2264612.1 DUF4237 domain-containing protein [Solihabitans fulvus]
MTAPQGPLHPEEQTELLRSLTVLFVHALPGDWGQLWVDFRSVGSHVELTGTVLNVFGHTDEWTPPDEAVAYFTRLRAGMYRPGEGTWTSAKYHLAHPDTFSVDYDWKNEPDFDLPVSQAYFREELATFPRAEENIPEWLREKAGLGPAPERPAPAARSGFYLAPVFDGTSEQGQPVVDRPAMHPQDLSAVLDYLKSAPVVLAARGYGRNAFAPDAEPTVPLTYHTDGTWVWAGATPYYLETRRVPPPPQLVKHIRELHHQVPEVDEDTQSAAIAVATGQAEPLPIPPYQPRVIDDRERGVLDKLRRRLDKFHVRPHEYAILEPKPDAMVLEPVPDGEGWQISYWDPDRGPSPRGVYPNVGSAATWLLGDLLFQEEEDGTRERFWASQQAADPQAAPAQPVQAPAIVPLPDEPPLSLFKDRQQVELPAGTEVDRFGYSTGNLAYAAGTRYANRSLPPDWINRGYHIYRLERPLPAVTGVAVPWFGQPGGGRAFLLPRSIEDLLADGSLVEIREATTQPPAPQQ